MFVVLRGGHVIDSSQGINQIMDVVIDGDRIEGVDANWAANREADEIDVRGKFVCPGLVDLHGHWYQGSAFGIDPDFCLNHGVTTAVDAGTTGFTNFGEFRRNQIAGARIQILAFLNISALGIPTPLNGELEDLRLARPKETADILAQNGDVLLGVKIRQGLMCGQNRAKALDFAIEAAQSAGVPLMVHIGSGATTAAILSRLRLGDIVTHCFQGRGDRIVADSDMCREAMAARERGVVFDVGHGCGSFSWDVAKRAFEHYFYPDTISTDLHRYSIDRWAVSLPTVMSKFLHLGMTLEEVIQKTTFRPAQVIGRAGELGTLKAGTVADIFVFDVQQGEFFFEDTHLRVEKADRLIRPSLVMKAGQVISPTASSPKLRPLLDCDRAVFDLVEKTA